MFICRRRRRCTVGGEGGSRKATVSVEQKRKPPFLKTGSLVGSLFQTKVICFGRKNVF